METRALTADDLPLTTALSKEAFGAWPAGTPDPDPATFPPPGRHSWGTLDQGVLLAKVMGREYHSWFHGVEVATNGIAGVAVRTESRGQGLLDDLFRVVLDEGLRERGEVISTLFPTAPGIYRRFGYELISSYDAVEVPTSALAAVRPAEGITLRRATADDFDAVRAVYDAWAAAHNGPLTRRGASFVATAQEFIDAFTGVTLACDAAGEVLGYSSWVRGSGYDHTATIEVADLLGSTPDALRALLRSLGSFATVTGHVRFETSGLDAIRLLLPSLAWPVTSGHAYMLRVHDVVGACTGLSLPEGGPVRFSVEGDLMETMDGSYELTGGTSVCTRVDSFDGPVFAPRGLAIAYAGAASCATIRTAGLLTGPATYDAGIDGLFGAREPHIRDYF
ncbi:GNAT family N-acetyltransferase [Nocardioides sp. InS609-2]|uniref:GNAT family N-acetyltransferase n=1 Tax=Nocardioides sp. InS609-2 TaxID=2760705 RepID=UPI0020BD7B2C|nr:GNAT family N-acetyltransferase [Nocardioides sp. InS609-2]